MKSKVSIIVPVYNSEKYLSSCLDSIINQTYQNLEIIIVNDGSTDTSLDICNEYKKNDDRIIIINQKNSGVSKARNNGILNSIGEYVTFVDSDDCISKDFVSEMVSLIEQNNSQLVVCNYRKNEECDETIKKIRLYSKNEAFYNLINNDNFAGYIWNKMYLRKLLISLSSEPFDCSIHVCEDFLLNCKYISKCNRISCTNKKLYIYNVNDSSATGNKLILNERKLTIIEAYRKIIKIYEKHSAENLDYVLYNFLKVLLYIKYTATKTNIIVNCEEDISVIWKRIKRSKRISLSKKIFVYLRIKFPIALGDLKNIFNYVRK